MPLFFDMTGYGFVILAMIISLFANYKVQSSYNKYSKVPTLEGRSGAQVAQMILNSKGINNVQITTSKGGTLSDHYDPRNKVVALSPKVYNDSSIASVSVAAHEVGHAIQDAEGYKFITLRNKLLPGAIVASKLSMLPIMIGLFNIDTMFGTTIFNIGIALLGVMALFQLVTLPVEFDASNRAIKVLRSEGILDASELSGAKNMLSAAAFTYVAALLGSILTILRFVALANSRRRN